MAAYDVEMDAAPVEPDSQSNGDNNAMNTNPPQGQNTLPNEESIASEQNILPQAQLAMPEEQIPMNQEPNALPAQNMIVDEQHIVPEPHQAIPEEHIKIPEEPNVSPPQNILPEIQNILNDQNILREALLAMPEGNILIGEDFNGLSPQNVMLPAQDVLLEVISPEAQSDGEQAMQQNMIPEIPIVLPEIQNISADNQNILAVAQKSPEDEPVPIPFIIPKSEEARKLWHDYNTNPDKPRHSREMVKVDLTPEYMCDKVIPEIQLRPVLYEPTIRRCIARKYRMQAWREVYFAVTMDWNQMSTDARARRASAIHKKWNEVYDLFAKELKKCRGKIQLITAKRDNLLNSLLFLVPVIYQKQNKINITPRLNSGTQTVEKDVSMEKNLGFGHQQMTGYLGQKMLEILTSKWNESGAEDDEDSHFGRMITSMLRRLDDEQRHYSRMEIVKIMHKAKAYRPKHPPLVIL